MSTNESRNKQDSLKRTSERFALVIAEFGELVKEVRKPYQAILKSAQNTGNLDPCGDEMNAEEEFTETLYEMTECLMNDRCSRQEIQTTLESHASDLIRSFQPEN